MKNILEPPEGRTIMENRTAKYWIDDEGILCSISKKVKLVTFEESLEIMAELKNLLQAKKVRMLLDVTNASPGDRQSREYGAQEFPKLVTAMAILSGSPVGRMLANISLAVSPQPYPIKMFGNEIDARAWLKQYE